MCLIASLFANGIFVNNADARIDVEMTFNGTKMVNPLVSTLYAWLGDENIANVIELLNHADPNIRMIYLFYQKGNNLVAAPELSKKLLGSIRIQTKIKPNEMKSLLENFPNVRNVITTDGTMKESYNGIHTYRFDTSKLSD